MAQPLTKDAAFHLLQNPRRRAVIRYLADHPDQEAFRMDTVAEEIAAWEYETTVQQLESDQRTRIYISLYQGHLPQLDEHGVIDYDQQRGIIHPTPLLPVLSSFVGDSLRDAESRLYIDSEDPETSRLSHSIRQLFVG